jgi:hypothetical protein
METSALNATNVEQAFTLLVTSIYQKKTPQQMDSSLSLPRKSTSLTVSEDHSQTPTVPVTFDTKVILEQPIRPSKNEKTSSQKKNGCCVIS